MDGSAQWFDVDSRVWLVFDAAVRQWHSLPSFHQSDHTFAQCHAVGFEHGAQGEFDLLVVRVGESVQRVLDEFFQIVQVGFAVAAFVEDDCHHDFAFQRLRLWVVSEEFACDQLFLRACAFRCDGVHAEESWTAFRDRFPVNVEIEQCSLQIPDIGVTNVRVVVFRFRFAFGA